MTKIDDELFKRLVLINQYTILSHVDPDQCAAWELAADKVRRHWPIDDLPEVEWLLESRRDPFTEEDRAFVRDVLSLYEALQHAENEKAAPTEARAADFDGFDGNSETKYMAYVRSLVDHDGLWTHIRRSNRDFNAHHATLDVYRRMLDAWQAMGRPFELTSDQYAAIQDARVHPSNRP